MPRAAADAEQTLSLRAPEVKSVAGALALYESAIRPSGPSLGAALLAAWTAFALAWLMWFSWAEPFSARLALAAKAAGWPAWLLDYAARPLVLAFRGIMFVEVFGYVYHRFFQHLGRLTRQAQFFRRNQKFHWMHHMILYPIGRFYKRAIPYVSSEGGLGISWLAPAFLSIGLAFATMGLHVGTFAWVLAAAAYAKFAVDRIHECFHEVGHEWVEKPYFKWLEQIHLLHHWDQRYNFSIVHPVMDVLCGSYLAPRSHQRELAVCLADEDLTVSDLINWRYLLIEASPAEYAAFISMAKIHPRSLRKIGHLMEVLHHRIERFPQDGLARLIRQRAVELMNLVQAPA